MRKIDFELDKAVESNYTNVPLDELISMYAHSKREYESYKEIYEQENKAIKQQMQEQGLTKHSVDGYTVRYVVQSRESWNESDLLRVAKKHSLNSVIKTTEYVDTDELEKVLYNMDDISDELVSDIDKCRTVKEVVTLRLKEDKK